MLTITEEMETEARLKYEFMCGELSFLRNRVLELAEQNTCLEKEISELKHDRGVKEHKDV